MRVNSAVGLGKVGQPAVELLIKLLKDEDKEVRMIAALALGEIKDPRALKPLFAALKDENGEVGMTAALALGEIKDPIAIEPLLAAVKDEIRYLRGGL